METGERAPAKRLLKTVGVVMILFGLGSFGMLTGLLVSKLTDAMYIDSFLSNCLVGFAGVLQLIAGIIGVRNCNKLDHSLVCLVWGIITLAISTISVVFVFVEERDFDLIEANQNIYLLF